MCGLGGCNRSCHEKFGGVKERNLPRARLLRSILVVPSFFIIESVLLIFCYSNRAIGVITRRGIHSESSPSRADPVCWITAAELLQPLSDGRTFHTRSAIKRSCDVQTNYFKVARLEFIQINSKPNSICWVIFFFISLRPLTPYSLVVARIRTQDVSSDIRPTSLVHRCLVLGENLTIKIISVPLHSLS